MYGINNILSSVSDTLTPPESLTGYGDTYIVTDLRKRGKKEPNEVKSLKAFRFVKNADAPKLFENVEPIKPDWFGIYKVFKGVNNGIIYLQYTFKKDYNADFLLNNYSIDENAKKITLTFDYVKAWNTKGYTAIRVSNVVMTLPVCNITFTNDIEVSGLFGLYDFVEGYIKALKNAQSNYRANSNDYKDLQYNIERYQTAWNKYAAQESAPVESPKASEPTPEPAQESPKENQTESAPENHIVTDKLIVDLLSADNIKGAIDELVYAKNHPGLSQIDLDKNKALIYSKLFTLAKDTDPEKVKQLIDYIKQSKLFTPGHRIFKILDNEKILKAQKENGLGKPTIKFEFNNNDEFKAFLNDNKENLIDSYIDADIADESPLNAKKIAVNGVGNPPAGIFNCPESELICNGFVPTYQRLDDYSHLIDDAENNNVLKGYGFDNTTLNTLIDAVKHYKQVARLAAHLAADTPEQTAFNIWHWLHCNVAYNYDTPGKEEIRTPARTWSDRKSGVDCDCLSVFTAALLINLGYHPKFEIVAFANKPQYSHIYVNLDGIAIDRVLPTFNRRPMLITKTMLMEIPVYQLNGLAGINATLQGVYENALRRFAHTQSGEDLLNMRKTQILISLQGYDYNGFRLAGLLMPYVVGVDDNGAYYFDNKEIADIAAKADDDVIAAEMRNASDEELNGLFKKIGKAIKKAAKKVADTTKKVVKTTAKAVKTVAKATANTVKAAAKSTVKAVKATAKLTKAAAQATTGKLKKAKATLKKAGADIKSAVVDPLKQAAKDTKAVVKDAVIEPTKTAVKVTVVEPTKTLVKAVAKSIKIAGKIFKVILVKINPVTVLMRNALRLLVAINFMGIATRLAVGKMSKEQALAAGYTESKWKSAQKSYNRVVKFFTKMGGKSKNIEKAIAKGSKKKALFKKDYKPNSQIIEKGDDDAALSGTSQILYGLDGLGAAITIGGALAAVGAFFAKMWGWIKNIVPKIGKGVAKAAKTVASKTKDVVSKVAKNEDVKKIATAAKDAAVNKAIETVQNKIGGSSNPDVPVDDLSDNIDNTTTTDKSKLLKYGLLAAAGIATVALIAGSKKRKKAA